MCVNFFQNNIYWVTLSFRVSIRKSLQVLVLELPRPDAVLVPGRLPLSWVTGDCSLREESKGWAKKDTSERLQGLPSPALYHTVRGSSPSHGDRQQWMPVTFPRQEKSTGKCTGKHISDSNHVQCLQKASTPPQTTPLAELYEWNFKFKDQLWNRQKPQTNKEENPEAWFSMIQW